MEFELVKFLGSVSRPTAAFILCMLAGSCNFPVDGLDEGVIRKAILLQLVKLMENIVGVHVGFEFS